MRLKSRDVNLILGAISFLLLISFIFFFYMPKHEKYTELVEGLDPLYNDYEEAQEVLKELPQLRDTHQIYKSKVDELRLAESNSASSGDINISRVLITLENIADRTQIDMKIAQGLSVPLNTPTTTDEEANEESEENDSEEAKENEEEGEEGEEGNEDEEAIEEDSDEPQVNFNDSRENANQNKNAFSVNLKGEYRSLIMFMFELRNLEVEAQISEFKLVYNEDEFKDEGFPLNANFNVVFVPKGGGSQ